MVVLTVADLPRACHVVRDRRELGGTTRHRSRQNQWPKPPRGRKTAGSDVFTSLITPVRSSRDFAQVALTLPKAHLHVLDGEAALLGLRRSQLLELLFLSDLGHKTLERLDIAPKYELARADLAATQRLLWYIGPEVKKLFDEHCLKLGLKPSAWAVTALNRWADLVEPAR
jgi:hypothetical protein